MADTTMNPSIHRREIDKNKKKKNGSVTEKEGSKEGGLGWVTQHGVSVRTAIFMRIWTQRPPDAVKKMLLN